MSCDSLYCNIRFIAVVWNWTHNFSEICLCTSESPGELVKNADSDSVDLAQGLRFYISNKFPGKADAGPKLHF